MAAETAPNPLDLLRPEIRALRGYTPGEQVNDCLKLNTNECAWPPSPAVQAVLANFDLERLRRYPDPRSQALRQAAGQLWGHDADGIVVGNGSDDCLTVLYRAFLRPGDRVACPWPTYGLYDTLAGIQGVDLVHVPWADNWALPSEQLIACGARLTIIANPNNPSATLIPVNQLLALAQQLPGILVVDEAYIDYAGSAASCIPFLNQHANLVVLRTCSKSFSLAGARLGFLFAAPALVDHLMKVKDSYNVNALTQVVGLAALNDHAYHQQLVANTLAARQELATAFTSFGWQWPTTAANFFLCRIADHQPSASTIYQALKAQGILVRWWDTDFLRPYLRITVGNPEENRRLISALTEIIHS